MGLILGTKHPKVPLCIGSTNQSTTLFWRGLESSIKNSRILTTLTPRNPKGFYSWQVTTGRAKRMWRFAFVVSMGKSRSEEKNVGFFCLHPHLSFKQMVSVWEIFPPTYAHLEMFPTISVNFHVFSQPQVPKGRWVEYPPQNFFKVSDIFWDENHPPKK